MSPEEKLEMGRKLIAEAEAEIAAKKRNWPEKIEPGMVFESNGDKMILSKINRNGDLRLIGLDDGNRFSDDSTFGMDGEESFAYLGRARDLIKIADDAHEPTGAELVGKMCMFRGFNVGQDDPDEWFGPWMCQMFDPDDATSAYRTGEVGDLTGWYKEARLAKDGE